MFSIKAANAGQGPATMAQIRERPQDLNRRRAETVAKQQRLRQRLEADLKPEKHAAIRQQLSVHTESRDRLDLQIRARADRSSTGLDRSPDEFGSISREAQDSQRPLAPGRSQARAKRRFIVVYGKYLPGHTV